MKYKILYIKILELFILKISSRLFFYKNLDFQFHFISAKYTFNRYTTRPFSCKISMHQKIKYENLLLSLSILNHDANIYRKNVTNLTYSLFIY